ncbi:hypothetical protein HN011_011266 [Eciton burchellii]|nr:hypothetical protein HN011_011266 [Eciton burchellii]
MHVSNFDRRCVTRTSRISALVIPADSAARNNSKDRTDAKSRRERCTILLLYLICSGGTYARRRVNIVYQKGGIEKSPEENMQLRSPVLLLLLCGVPLLTAQERAEECQRSIGDELIWEYDVRRPHRIGGYQEVEADYGPTDARITCIRFNSLSDMDNAAAWITSGGVGHNFVKLKFRSKHSRGLRYQVFVYGEPTLRRGKLRLL